MTNRLQQYVACPIQRSASIVLFAHVLHSCILQLFLKATKQWRAAISKRVRAKASAFLPQASRYLSHRQNLQPPFIYQSSFDRPSMNQFSFYRPLSDQVAIMNKCFKRAPSRSLSSICFPFSSCFQKVLLGRCSDSWS